MGILRYIRITFIDDFKKNFCYMITLIISIILIFNMFNVIFNEKIVKYESDEYYSMSLLGFVILVVSVFFVVFSNSYYLEGKIKEYGVITISGRSIGDVCRIITIRNAIMTISALIIGSVIGYLISPIVMATVLKIANIEGDIYYVSQNSLVLTCMIMFSELASIFLCNTGTIYRKSINELMTSSRRENFLDRRRLKISGIIYVLAFISPILTLIFISILNCSSDIFMLSIFLHIFGIQGMLRYVIPDTISKYRKRKLVNDKYKLIILSNLYNSIRRSTALILVLVISVVLTMSVESGYAEGTILNIMSILCYGLVVGIVSITIVYKFLVEARKRKGNFIQLKLLGYTTSEIKKIISTEVIVFYTVIIVLALISITVVSLEGIMSGLISTIVGCGLIISYIVVLVLTSIISYFGYKKIALV